MESVATILKGLHIVAASASLLILVIPLVAKKGGALHRRVGWIWAATMVVSIASGIAMSLLAIALPAAMRPGVSPATVRTWNLFLLLVGGMSASAVWQGVRAIGRKRSAAASRHPMDIGLPAGVIALAGVVLGLGVMRGHVLSILFGLGAAFLALGHLRFAWRPLPSKMAWWYGHMNGMLGAVIVAITAFAIAGLQRWITIPRVVAFIPWIAPGLLLGPVSAFWQRYYRARFGDRGIDARPRETGTTA